MEEQIKEEISIVTPKNRVLISNSPETSQGIGTIDGVSGFLENLIIKASSYGIINITTDDGIQIYNGWIDAGVHVFPIRFQAKTNDGDAWFSYNAERLLLDNNSIIVVWERKDSTCEVILRICQNN